MTDIHCADRVLGRAAMAGKAGVGRLPGDVKFTLFGKTIFLPFASTILLSTVIFLLAARFL
jgi:hypothetical protein